MSIASSLVALKIRVIIKISIQKNYLGQELFFLKINQNKQEDVAPSKHQTTYAHPL
jgi:hypothetical protein